MVPISIPLFSNSILGKTTYSWVWGLWEIFRHPSLITTNLIGNVGPGTCQSPPSTTYPIGSVGPCPNGPQGFPTFSLVLC